MIASSVRMRLDICFGQHSPSWIGLKDTESTFLDLQISSPFGWYFFFYVKLFNHVKLSFTNLVIHSISLRRPYLFFPDTLFSIFRVQNCSIIIMILVLALFISDT